MADYWQQLKQVVRVIFLGTPLVFVVSGEPASKPHQDTIEPNRDKQELVQLEQALASENAAFYLELAALIQQFKQGDKQPLIDFLTQFDLEHEAFPERRYLSFRFIFRQEDNLEGFHQIPEISIQFNASGTSVRDRRAGGQGQQPAEGDPISTMEEVVLFLASDEVDQADLEVRFLDTIAFSAAKPDTLEYQELGEDILVEAFQQQRETLMAFGQLLSPFSPELVSKITREEVVAIAAEQGWTVADGLPTEVEIRREVTITPEQGVREEITFGRPWIYAATEEVSPLDTDPDEVMRFTERVGLRLGLTRSVDGEQWSVETILLIPQGGLDNHGQAASVTFAEVPFILSTGRVAELLDLVEEQFNSD